MTHSEDSLNWIASYRKKQYTDSAVGEKEQRRSWRGKIRTMTVLDEKNRKKGKEENEP